MEDEQIVTSNELMRQSLRAQLATAMPAYLTVDDKLRLVVLNALAGASLTVQGLLLNDEGQLTPFAFSSTPTSARAASVATTQVGQGWLMKLEAISGGSPRQGQTWIALQVIRGTAALTFAVHTLVEGYVAAEHALVWPGSTLSGPIPSAMGMLRSVQGAAPAAGADFTVTVPVGARWKLRGLRSQLVTAIAAATRQVHIKIDDGATQLFDFPANGTQVASLTRNYDFSEGLTAPAATDSEIYGPLAVDLMLFQGWRIASVTTAIQAADAWGAQQLAVEEWLEL